MTLRTLLVAGAIAGIAPAPASAQAPILTSALPARVPAGAQWARSVHVDVGALNAAAAAGRAVVLDLAPGIRVTTIPERVTRRGVKRFSWFGTVVGGGHVTLTVEGPRMYGRIVTPGRAVMIEPAGAAHVVYEPAPLDADGDGEDALPAPPRAIQGFSGGDELFPDELHLAVFYTSQVADSLGDGIDVFLQATVDQLTDVLANSNVPMSARLVFGGEVDHTETVQLSGNLSAFQDPADGDMDEVHDIRNAVSADMMALLVETGINSATGCGVAYLMGSLDPDFESAAFSVTKRRCAPELVFSHEVGHNLGLHHDTYVAPGPGLFNYSHGFVNTDSMNIPPGRPGFRTPLAYHSACADAGGECVRIPYYSNPELLYGGMPMGNATTADNARTVRQSGPLTATFRAPILLATSDGSTAGAPTWQRPECSEPSDPDTCVPSGTANAVPYHSWPFHVTRTGRHYVRSAAAFEGVLVLYSGPFNPGAPLDGIVGYAEPDPTAPATRRLLLPVDLVVGAPYVLVTTGMGNGDSGAFTNSTYGPTGGGVVVSGEGAPSANALELSAPAPNPGRGQISMTLLTGQAQEVRAELFDPLGRRVAVLLDASLGVGTSVPLVIDVAGVSPGVYIVRVVGDGVTLSRTVTVTR